MKILSMPAGGVSANVIYKNGQYNPVLVPFHEWHREGTSNATYNTNDITLTCNSSSMLYLYTAQKVDLTDVSTITLKYDFANNVAYADYVILGISPNQDATTWTARAGNAAGTTPGVHALTLDVSTYTGLYYIGMYAQNYSGANGSGKLIEMSFT